MPIQYEPENDDHPNALPFDEDYVPGPPQAATSSPAYAFPAPQRSAGLLRWGIGLAGLGIAGYSIGSSMTLDWMLAGGYGDNAGAAVSLLSSVATIVGVACTVFGIRRLATSIDYIAFRTHLEEHGKA